MKIIDACGRDITPEPIETDSVKRIQQLERQLDDALRSHAETARCWDHCRSERDWAFRSLEKLRFACGEETMRAGDMYADSAEGKAFLSR